MPERTVDAWVTAAICRRFPNALFWGPTQVPRGANWDFGVSLGPGKVLVLEDKATSPVRRTVIPPLDTHRVYIARNQLDEYCDHIEPGQRVPVFYVLPAPPWQGLPTGSSIVPDQAVTRTASPLGPFEDWAFVVRCTDLRLYLGPRQSLETHELPFGSCLSLASFIDEVARCRIGERINHEGDGLVGASTTPGQLRPDDSSASRGRGASEEIHKKTGSSLSVFIPAGDLPAWS